MTDGTEMHALSSESLEATRIASLRPPKSGWPRGEDLPCDDGEPLETYRHRQQMNLLIESLERAWSHRDDFFAGGNMFLYYSPEQTKRKDFRGPDVFVVLNTSFGERKSWVAWEEDFKLPDVIIEITSDSTRKIDRGPKKELYEKRFKTQAYYIYDPFSFELEGWQLDDDGHYQPLAIDENGIMPCPPLGLGLAVRTGSYHRITHAWLRWVDDAHRVLPTDGEAVKHTETELRSAQVNVDEERQRAEQEHQRAEQESKRAEQERQRAERAEQELAALRAQLTNQD